MQHNRNFVTNKRYNQPYQNINENTNDLSNCAYQFRLSPEERKSIKNTNNKYMIESMNLGDDAQKKNDYVTEAFYHREIQEYLRNTRNILHTDPESIDSYNYNSAIIHAGRKVKIAQEMGYTFNQMFSLNETTGKYMWIVPNSVIPTDDLIDNEPYSNSYNNTTNSYSKGTNNESYGNSYNNTTNSYSKNTNHRNLQNRDLTHEFLNDQRNIDGYALFRRI